MENTFSGGVYQPPELGAAGRILLQLMSFRPPGPITAGSTENTEFGGSTETRRHRCLRRFEVRKDHMRVYFNRRPPKSPNIVKLQGDPLFIKYFMADDWYTKLGHLWVSRPTINCCLTQNV